jgi:hypothetical protein
MGAAAVVMVVGVGQAVLSLASSIVACDEVMGAAAVMMVVGAVQAVLSSMEGAAPCDVDVGDGGDTGGDGRCCNEAVVLVQPLLSSMEGAGPRDVSDGDDGGGEGRCCNEAVVLVLSLCCPAWRVLTRVMWAMGMMVEGRGAAATKR